MNVLSETLMNSLVAIQEKLNLTTVADMKFVNNFCYNMENCFGSGCHFENELRK